MKIGIDASRNRSGGARAHIIGILSNFDSNLWEKQIQEVHIWSYPELLNLLPDQKWLIKHTSDELNKSIFHQLWWQYKKLPIEASNLNIDILLNTDAGTVCRFKTSVTMSRDMLSYEPGEMQRFGFSFQRFRLMLLRYVQNYSLKHSTAAIFLTKYAADVIQKSTGIIDNYAIIPHGVSDNFRLTIDREEFNSTDRINCIYVSNVSFYKHQNQVAKAISLLRSKYDINIKFIGGGEGKAQKEFIRVVSEVDPNGLFIYQHEFVKHTELPTYLHDADLFIFASSCENMPNTLIEGMSIGLPVVCSDRGPMPEVLEDGGLYFDPENAQMIAAVIEEIIINKEMRCKLRKRSRTISEKYSWKRCANETFNFLIEVYIKAKNK